MGKPNPKQKFGDKKVKLQYVPPILAIETAGAMAEGAEKYGPYNWREDAVEVMTYIGAIQRHASAYLDGEDIDPESKNGKSHLAGLAANVAIILDAASIGKLIDNRPPKGVSGQRIRDLANGVS